MTQIEETKSPQYIIEGIILRRMHEKRIEGYTLEMSKEIAAALAALPRSAATTVEPVAWQWRYLGETGWKCLNISNVAFYDQMAREEPDAKYVCRPLYAAPTTSPEPSRATATPDAPVAAALLAVLDDKLAMYADIRQHGGLTECGEHGELVVKGLRAAMGCVANRYATTAPSRTTASTDAVREAAEALRLLSAYDDRLQKLHDLLETIREQIRLGVEPEHRPDGLFRNIQDAVYAMRGRTLLMNDAAITGPLQAIADPRHQGEGGGPRS